MSTQKFIKYTSLKSDGQFSDFKLELRLNVSGTSGNHLLHRNLLRHYSSQKQGTVSTKTRSEVKGGGRKPWQQKGTGRARAGSNRSPLWKGGGVTFGPKPKRGSLKVNKKERNLALQTLLYNKKNNTIIIENLENALTQTKTKEFLKICRDCKICVNQKILVIVEEKSQSLKISTRNLKNVELISAKSLNIFSLLKANQVLLTSSAIYKIKEIYCE